MRIVYEKLKGFFIIYHLYFWQGLTKAREGKMRTTKGFFISFVCFVFLVGLSGSVNAFSGSGSGTSGDPYQITTCAQLQEMKDDLSAYYVLANNINCSATISWNGGAGFEPVGTFIGTLDGKGFNVNGLFINRPSTDNVGLFGMISGGSLIRNIGLIDSNITGRNKVGGLVGRASTGSIIEDSFASGSVTGDGFVGGLVGIGFYNIARSFSSGRVIGVQPRVGGFIGWFGGSGTGGIINNSYSKANVSSSHTGIQSEVGGFVGENEGSIYNSYATGDVIGAGQNTGGFVGYNSFQDKITNSYAIGNVDGNDRVGGFAGGSSFPAPISNSFSTGNVSGTTNVGSFQGHTHGAVPINSFWLNITGSCIGNMASSCDSNDINNITYFFNKSNEPMASWNFPPWDSFCDDSGHPPLAWEGLSDVSECKGAEITENILDVPLYKQGGPLVGQDCLGVCPEWGDERFGPDIYTYDCGVTPEEDIPLIRECGCTLTSIVMVLRAYGITKGPNGEDVNPSTLNTWLINAKDKNGNFAGYGQGGLNFWQIPRYTMEAQEVNEAQPILEYGGPVYPFNLDAIQNELIDGIPVILDLGERYGHFVVAKGIVSTPTDTLVINDPGYDRNTLEPFYGEPFPRGNHRIFTETQTDLSALIILVDPTVGLLVTDPLGRQTGVDPDTGIEINNIPGAAYYLETNLANDVTGVVPTNPSARTFSVPDPVAGTYDVKVIGTATQNYTVDFLGYDQEGNPTIETVPGFTVMGGIQSYQTVYSPTPGVPFAVQLKAQIDIKPGSYPNSVNPRNRGKIPVAILTTQTFDATTVDPLSVKFGPNGALEAHGRGHYEDFDGDGDTDLVLHFSTQFTGIQCGDTKASLTGETYDGQKIIGSDSIVTKKCK